MIHGGDIYSHKIEYDFSVNLNPVSCPDIVMEALKRSLDDISNYPDLKQRRIKEALVKIEKVKQCNIMAGNGASELIMAVVRMINPGSVVIVQPSFYGYIHAIKGIQNCKIIPYKLREENDFAVTEDFAQFIRNTSPDMVIIANPNNPTGRLVDKKLLEEIICVCDEIDSAVLVDECFLRMSSEKESIGPMVTQHDNLFVVNAFTKCFSIPGVRIGYIIASEKNIACLKRFLPEWNMSVFSENAAVACASVLSESDSYIDKTSKTIFRERKYLSDSLESLVDKVYKSDTSFLLVRSDQPLYEMLLANKILIRDCSNFEGLGKGFFRIAVKNHDSNKMFVDTLRKVITNGN